MPFVSVKMFEGRTMEQKRKIVEGITKVLIDVLKVDKTGVRVIFEDFSRDNWSIGGEIVSDKEKKAAKK